MKKHKFIIVVLTLVILGQTSFVAYSDSDTPKAATSKGTPKNTIVVVTESEPATLDPAKNNNQNIGVVLDFVCDGLWSLQPDGTYANKLAQKWEMRDDTTLYIQLKKGIKFSDGTPLKAEDVLWEFIRTSQQAVSKSQFNFIDIEKSKILSDTELIVKFKQPWAPFESSFGTGRGLIVSKKAFERLGESAFSRAPIGTGPYKIVEWVSGSYVKLVENEYYWGDRPRTKNILIKFINEPAGRVIELETGQADIAYYIEGSDIERVNNLKGYHIEKGDSYRYFVLMLSMKEPLFKNRDIRYAMSYAIDKKALIDVGTNGIGLPISSMGPPLVIDGMKKQPEIPYNVAKAKELMAKSGYPNGFTIDLHIEPTTLFNKLAETVQAMWAEIGVKANIVVSPLATYDAQHNGRFQASIRDGTAQEISNVWTVYESTFGSRMNANDEWLDKKLLELRTYYKGNPKRTQIANEIADYLYSIRYSYPFMVMPTIYGVSDKMEGFVFHPSVPYLDVAKWIVYQ